MVAILLFASIENTGVKRIIRLLTFNLKEELYE